MIEQALIAEVAAHLRWMSNQLRLNGDIEYFLITDDAVSKYEITVADDLWLQALILDPEHCFDDPYSPDGSDTR